MSNNLLTKNWWQGHGKPLVKKLESWSLDDTRKLDDFPFVFITNEMAVNLNVFGPLMEDWIFRNPDGTHIIA